MILLLGGGLFLFLSLSFLSGGGAVVVVVVVVCVDGCVDGWMVFALPIANRDRFRVLCCCCRSLAGSVAMQLGYCYRPAALALTRALIGG